LSLLLAAAPGGGRGGDLEAPVELGSPSCTERPPEKTGFYAISYDERSVEEREDASLDEALSLINKRRMTWIDVTGPREEQAVRAIAKALRFHPFVVESLLEQTERRPRTEDFEDHIYLTWYSLCFMESDHGIERRQIHLIMGKSFVVTFQKDRGAFSGVKEWIKNEGSRIRKLGADYLLYSLVDAVVDSYFRVSEKIGDEIEYLQDRLIAETRIEVLENIQEMRRHVTVFRRSIWPLREAISELEKGESDLIEDATGVYFREVYDHTIELMDTVDTSRDILSELVDMYQTNVSNQLNQIVKVLTIISVIFAPLTFIVGLYGMNFRYMPEISHEFGYPAVLVILGIIAVLMLAFFWKKGWMRAL